MCSWVERAKVVPERLCSYSSHLKFIQDDAATPPQALVGAHPFFDQEQSETAMMSRNGGHDATATPVRAPGDNRLRCLTTLCSGSGHAAHRNVSPRRRDVG